MDKRVNKARLPVLKGRCTIMTGTAVSPLSSSRSSIDNPLTSIAEWNIQLMGFDHDIL